MCYVWSSKMYTFCKVFVQFYPIDYIHSDGLLFRINAKKNEIRAFI